MHQSRGKTLLELLTVMAIIALLMGLILSATFWAINYAKRAHCTANLRQLYIALQAYVEDFKEPPPRALLIGNGRFRYDWEILALYRPAIRPLLICPSDSYQGQKDPAGNPLPFPSSYILSYVYPYPPLFHPDPEVARVYDWFSRIDPSNPNEVFITCMWHGSGGRVWGVFADGRIGWVIPRYCEVDGRRFYYYRPIELTEEQCRRLFVDLLR